MSEVQLPVKVGQLKHTGGGLDSGTIENTMTDFPVSVDVGMIDWRCETTLWWECWVILLHVDVQDKCSG